MEKQEITKINTIFIANKCQKSAQGKIIYPSVKRISEEEYNSTQQLISGINKNIEYIYVFGENIAYYEDNGYLYKIEANKTEEIGEGYILIEHSKEEEILTIKAYLQFNY